MAGRYLAVDAIDAETIKQAKEIFASYKEHGVITGGGRSHSRKQPLLYGTDRRTDRDPGRLVQFAQKTYEAGGRLYSRREFTW